MSQLPQAISKTRGKEVCITISHSRVLDHRGSDIVRWEKGGHQLVACYNKADVTTAL